MDATSSATVMTTAWVESEIRRLDRLIASAEPGLPHLRSRDCREYLAMKQRRRVLKDILLARDIERGKTVVSLKRWRHGLMGRGTEAMVRPS
jgi:hypothetical protein